MFQMFSIASVMLFGAIVVNLYSRTDDALMSQNTRRKLIQTLAPLVHIRQPTHLLVHKKIKKADSVCDMNGVKNDQMKMHELKSGIKLKTETWNNEEDHDTIVKEWQTIALIMDRVFLGVWAISNLAALTTTLVLL